MGTRKSSALKRFGGGLAPVRMPRNGYVSVGRRSATRRAPASGDVPVGRVELLDLGQRALDDGPGAVRRAVERRVVHDDELAVLRQVDVDLEPVGAAVRATGANAYSVLLGSSSSPPWWAKFMTRSASHGFSWAEAGAARASEASRARRSVRDMRASVLTNRGATAGVQPYMRRTMAVLLATGLLAAAGCGDDDDEEPSGSTQAAPAETQTEAEAPPAAETESGDDSGGGGGGAAESSR